MQTLQADIQKDPRVDGVTYVSKAQALERFKKRTANSPELVEQLRGNPLPASFEIKLKNPRQVAAVVKSILAMPALTQVIKDQKADVKWGQDIVEKLFAATGIVRSFVLVFVIMLLLVSLVLIGNTIRLAIFSRRKEIGIMRLVGASNWFIRTPFLFEGVFQAIIGRAAGHHHSPDRPVDVGSLAEAAICASFRSPSLRRLCGRWRACCCSPASWSGS